MQVDKINSNEIRDYINYVSGYRPQNNMEIETINTIRTNLDRYHNEFINIINYVNGILRCNNRFYSILDLQRFVNNAISQMNQNDIRKNNLISVTDPINNLNNGFNNTIGKFNNVIKANKVPDNNYNNINFNNIYKINTPKTNKSSGDNCSNINIDNISKANGESSNNNNAINSQNFVRGYIPPENDNRNNYINNNMNNNTDFFSGENMYKVIYIIGIVMVLIGLSIFGRYVYVNYLGDFAKGMLLYAVGALVILLNEIIVKKKNKSFSRGLFIFGICELCISTLINSIALENINSIVAFILVALISLGAMLYSYREKSAVIRCFSLIVSLVGILISFNYKDLDYLASIIVIGYIVILNTVNLALPIRGNMGKLRSLIISSTLVNCFLFMWLACSMEDLAISVLGLLYILMTLFIDKLLLKEEECVINDFSVLFYTIVMIFTTKNEFLDAISAIICIICFIVSKRKIMEEYLLSFTIFILNIAYYLNIEYFHGTYRYITLLFAIILIYFSLYENKHKSMLIKSVVYICTIILVIFTFVRMLIINNIDIISLDTLMYIDNLLVSVIVLALCISIAIINRKKETEYNIFKYCSLAVVFPLAYFTNKIFSVQYLQFIIMGVIYTGFIYLCSNIDYLKNRNYKKENFIINIILLVLSLVTMQEITFSAIIYYCICIFCSVTICFEKYCDVFKEFFAKSLYINIISILCLFSLITIDASKISINILSDVLIMIIACVDLYIGIKIKEKNSRILGVIIGIGVCIKVLLVDSVGMGYLAKTILFIAIGILAIILAFIYSQFFKKKNDNDKNSFN